MNIISRKDAISAGLKRYFTGNPCLRGHISERLIGGVCCECNREKSREVRLNTNASESALQKRRAYFAEYQRNRRSQPDQKEKEIAAGQKYRSANRELLREKGRIAEMARYKRIKSDLIAAAEYNAKAAERARRPKNRAKQTAYQSEYKKRRKQNCPEYAALISMRQMIHRCLRYANESKRARTIDALKYSPSQLRDHLESWFVEGMGWHNRSQWHIDHVIPVAEFVRLGIKDPAKINALENLRPVWASENIAKGDGFALVMPS